MAAHRMRCEPILSTTFVAGDSAGFKFGWVWRRARSGARFNPPSPTGGKVATYRHRCRQVEKAPPTHYFYTVLLQDVPSSSLWQSA